VVERGSYLFELIRYVVCSPVRAGMCSRPEEWRWSSHRSVLGKAGRQADGRVHAFRRRRATVDVADDDARHSLVVGSESFAAAVIDRSPHPSPEVPRKQWRLRPPVARSTDTAGRNDAIRRAYASGLHSLSEIGRHFGVHYSTVSRICGRRAAST